MNTRSERNRAIGGGCVLSGAEAAGTGNHGFGGDSFAYDMGVAVWK